MSNNPKAFYNQSDYNTGGGSRTPINHKPDQVSASDLLPPPPYSPDPTRKSSDSTATYGSTEQQVGLLSQDSQPFSPSAKKKLPNREAPNQQQSSSNPHQEHLAVPIAYERSPPSGRRRANGDPGCCRKWCKYLFAAILIWLVLLTYTNKFDFFPPSNTPPRAVCRNDAVSWQKLPRTIDFEKNIEIELVGQVSGGRVVLTPTKDRHGGTISSEIQFTPSSLDEQMTYDIQLDDDTTKLLLTMPPHISGDDCINLNMEIRLPYSADLVRLNMRNVDVLVLPFVKSVDTVDIKTSNGKIESESWSGEYLKLVTSSADIKVGSLFSGGSVYIENSNGAIYMSNTVEAKDTLDVRNSNGLIEALGTITADNSISIRTSNDNVRLESLFSDDVFVESSNGPIQIERVESKTQVTVKSSNAPISLNVAGEKNNKVVVLTSEGEINLHMTNEFEGHFVASTSNGQVTIDDDTGIEYQDNLDYLKRGERYRRGKGDLTATSSNADVNIAFDISN
ncbi:uncharacterized protein EV154DRAFT_599277 [Mucor mucedo]|uniref:uncharacterized protein n=1 Tax=Mucor mucedo TaxID=29922 RepID=UPI0022206655|nr:uncharacterized protein EV154DRAFT_599277 [Mucor mucedo]KAI7895364.1 hypothetical protein EV154DRAFT_599277 [Mucor mucedo]